MRRILITAAFTALFSLSAAADGNGGCLPSSKTGQMPFGPGETLNYALSFNWHSVATDVARASTKVDTLTFNGKKAYHVRMQGRTAQFFEIFYKVREDFQSWFTCDGLKPLKFIRDTHEGNYFAYNLYHYNPREGVINAALNNKKHGRSVITLPLGKCTYDLPGLLFYCRNMDITDLSPGKGYTLSFAIDDDVYSITLTYKGRETKQIKGLGNVACMKFGCSVVEGEMFDGKEDAELWISDDDNRIPVYFFAPMRVGGVSGRLSSWSGLAHEFTSLKSGKK